MSDRPIRSVAVGGGGTVGLSAALAFARALPGTAVQVIETPPDPAALADRMPTALPSAAAFHAAVGIEEADLVRAGIATHHLGTRFEHWSATGEAWVHAFGPYGKAAGAIPFDHIWLRARQAGKALPYDAYSVGAALIRAGKFVHPSRDPEFVGSRFAYGLRFDPERYRSELRLRAERSGVDVRSAGIAEVVRNAGGGVAALLLDDGSRVAADLFIDCTGPAARLIGAIDDSFEDWSAWLPFDRLRLSWGPAPDVPSPGDTVTADESGWTGEWTLPGRTMSARLTSEEDGEAIALTRGRRLRPWVGNVLALGDAAIALDPLHGMNLDAAHRAILLALELLPGRDMHPLETGEYNRRAEQVTRRVRDFIALHYLRGPRPVGGAEPPDSLARTLDQFEHRGRMPFHEEESVTRDSWTAALLGMGVVPRNVDPQAGAVPLEQAVTAMERLAGEIDQAVATLPSYAEHLARIAAPQPR